MVVFVWTEIKYAFTSVCVYNYLRVDEAQVLPLHVTRIGSKCRVCGALKIVVIALVLRDLSQLQVLWHLLRRITIFIIVSIKNCNN